MSDRARASGAAGVSRRDFIQRAVAAGVMASPAAALLSACGLGTSGGSGSGSGSASSENPFGVNASTPLNIVIFKGGYGDDYAKYDMDLYKKRYSGAQLTETGMQQLAQHLQPQFVAGTPPDVLDDSGAGNIAPGSLVSQGQLAELGDLFDAPSIDDPKSKVKDTLIAGTQEAGAFSGKQYGMIYTLSLYSIWYSQPLFKEKGWSYPRTWPEMLTLCAEIQKTGMAPWIYQGKYPVYMIQIWQEMAQKLGGPEVLRKIDNLEPNAWKQPEVLQAVEALYELADKGYIMQGTAGLTHIQAQAAWLQKKAAFIPCGSWLPNEMASQVPSGFDMVIAPTPSLTRQDKMPFNSVNASGTELFVVPSKAKNVAGGKEFLRIMLSKEACRKFSELTQTLTVVKDAAKGLSLGTAVQSSQDLLAKGAPNVPTAQYGGWYQELSDTDANEMGNLLTKAIKPQDYVNRLQQKADAVAKDSSIKKFNR